MDRPDEKLPQEIISFDSYFAKTGWGYTPYIACAKIYDKQAFSIIRYPLGKITEDLFTTYKVLYPYESIVRVNSVLYFYYQTEKSIMRDHWNPKRLDEIEASEQLLRFMREKGFHSAEKTSYDRFLWVLRTQISMIRSEKNSRFALLERRLLRKGRRLLLSWYDKSAPISEYNEDYEFFFPKLNYFYWTCRGILGKLKRMVKK